jgi:hypothetical protein
MTVDSTPQFNALHVRYRQKFEKFTMNAGGRQFAQAKLGGMANLLSTSSL